MAQNIQQLDKNFATSTAPDDALTWHDIRDLGVDGHGFEDTESFYDRLPVRAKGVVSDRIWNLSKCSSGLSVTFATDAAVLHGRWRLRVEHLALPHMPASGASGLDLYGWTGERWRFAGAAQPDKFPENQGLLAPELDGQKRVYRLYLPLYNGVEKVEIGLAPGAFLAPAHEPGAPHATARKPIVFYGTSILQGGCASRPGMAYPAVLGRLLHRRTINLGFSGSARCEPEIADLLAELDPCAYVLDPLPNMSPELVAERIEPFVRTLRAARPETLIVLVENITYQAAAFRPTQRKSMDNKNTELRAAHQRLLSAGVPHLHHMPGASLFGDDGEATVDGTHATDVGFLRMAQAMEPVLRPLV